MGGFFLFRYKSGQSLSLFQVCDVRSQNAAMQPLVPSSKKAEPRCLQGHGYVTSASDMFLSHGETYVQAETLWNQCQDCRAGVMWSYILVFIGALAEEFVMHRISPKACFDSSVKGPLLNLMFRK